jgi:Lrp/AsnC family transcriptional regulator, leucine-responsive regulatory protein
MDDIDRQILEALQKDNQIGMDRLGDAVGLSASAAQRRVKRLRADDVITGDISVVEPASVGRRMTFIVEVTLIRENATIFEAFKRRMRDAPEVQQCYYVTGDEDFVLIVTAADMTEYESIATRLFLGDANVARYRTSVVMNRVKVSLAVPVLQERARRKTTSR